MPIYEFVCERCEKEFEELVRSYSSQATCPGCESTEVRRLLSTFSYSSGSTYSSSAGSSCSSCTSSSCSSCKSA